MAKRNTKKTTRRTSKKTRGIRVVERVGINERAVLARLDRLLSPQGKSVRRCREDGRQYPVLGRFYVLDLNESTIIEKHVDLEKYARRLGVLHEYEELID